jgi:hypothetical protein
MSLSNLSAISYKNQKPPTIVGSCKPQRTKSKASQDTTLFEHSSYFESNLHNARIKDLCQEDKFKV